MGRDRAIVLASGGMDSCVSAAIAQRTHDIAMLHFSYGQRTEARELKAFHDVAGALDAASRLVIRMGHLAAIGGSSLTDTSIPVSPPISEPETFRRRMSLSGTLTCFPLLSAGPRCSGECGVLWGRGGRLIGVPGLPKVVFPGV